MTAPTASPGRVDARRNRARLVTAARELFAARGVDVPTREVARRAGVGVGTLYRHFPERDDLVDAVLEDAFAAFVAMAESALAVPDAWTGFASFLEEALLLHARNRAVREVVETRTHGRERASAMRSRLRPLLAALVRRAQDEGTLRADFTAEDLPLLFWASDRIIDVAGGVAPEIWRRHLGFVLDGLRCDTARALAQPPLTEEQLRLVGAPKSS